jgi:uracil-DNA glycosylase family 4
MDYVHLLGASNGPQSARVLFVGEAPGRLGAARTGVPFSGDASGHRFERLLHVAGLRREDVFITNAVLCNPLSDGHNRRPSTSEVADCADFLAEQIRMVDPAVVVALGNVALGALRRLAPHDLALDRHAGRPHLWQGRLLVPLYHPGPRAAVHRHPAQQESDWHRLGRLVRRLGLVPLNMSDKGRATTHRA